jgi:hypothetical protein
VFEEMMMADVVSWNCVMHCNVRYGCLDRALRKFRLVVSTRLAPIESALSLVLLSECGCSKDLHHGRVLYGWVVKSEELDPDLPLHNVLLDMYS